MQYGHEGRCCDKCAPGTYVMEFCSETHETKCSPCQEGTYADKHHSFDRCEKCPSCYQALTQKCTKTSRGNCSCQSDFLCSDSACSQCEKNKCSAGEEPWRIGSMKYSYQCKPKCPGNHYFDAKDNICKPWTQCSVKGLAERIPGNKTHDSVCAKPEKEKDASLQWIVSTGFVLLSLTLFVFVFYTCLKKLKRNRRNHAAGKVSVHAVGSKTSDFHLSKEESGFQFIIQDKFQDCCSVSQLHLEKVSTLS
ncbi:tumor necrosis factor receptor superfamily member 18 [Girardinichthys multiradiatus]|uniref:tumor necrosis factor receptor superfamily member 18 n=1 Tax=Girardinichthys multiradiatus TaxID=208333 RepID=UPI001FAD66FD|nr:tumor necrosis factor receptor superfamily member 18 [Girardinichthys multiradiatus]